MPGFLACSLVLICAIAIGQLVEYILTKDEPVKTYASRTSSSGCCSSKAHVSRPTPVTRTTPVPAVTRITPVTRPTPVPAVTPVTRTTPVPAVTPVTRPTPVGEPVLKLNPADLKRNRFVNLDDYYAILDVSVSATKQDILTAYFYLYSLYGNNPEYKSLFVYIEIAFNTLSNTQKREFYDSMWDPVTGTLQDPFDDISYGDI